MHIQSGSKQYELFCKIHGNVLMGCFFAQIFMDHVMVLDDKTGEISLCDAKIAEDFFVLPKYWVLLVFVVSWFAPSVEHYFVYCFRMY